jgi:serine/threonine-protein kinase
MNEATPTCFETLSLTLGRDVDRVCDQFEDAWKAGQQPRIEDFLGTIQGEGRSALLCELIRLDDYYRRAAYRQRFPELDAAWLAGGLGPEPGEGRRTARYTLVRPHADGGIGRVSLQHDSELRRDVALKELHPDKVAEPEVLGRFLQEAQITSQLEHPGIVPVYDLVKPAAGRPPFYTMRFVKGRTLTEATLAYHQKRLAGQATSLDLLTLLNAFVGVCQAVAYAHARGVIHRDLKGRNVVLGDFGEVIVLDWGLAKLLEAPHGEAEALAITTDEEPRQDRTVQGQVQGTPHYMAPEQASGRVDLIGPRTDVYGLGAILYEILTGRPPFTGSGLRELLVKVQEEEPARPSSLVAEVPAGLEAACLRALAKSPAERQTSATALAAEVQQWLADSAERSRAEQERERFFNLSLDMLCTVGFDNRFKQVNPAWEKTLGWAREELESRPYLELVHPDDRAATVAEGARVAAGEGRPGFENRYRCKDGSYRWISWTANLIPGEQLLYAVGRDVTERKRAEEALRRSQERFELAVRGSGDGLWDWDLETNLSYYSPRWKSMLGYEDHELSHDLAEWVNRLHPEDRAGALAALQAYIDGRAPAYEIEYRLEHKDGSYRWILDRGVALRNAGKVYRMAGSHTDITERKQMEQTLRQSEAHHRAVLAAMKAELARYREELERLSAGGSTGEQAATRPDP